MLLPLVSPSTARELLARKKSTFHRITGSTCRSLVLYISILNSSSMIFIFIFFLIQKHSESSTGLTCSWMIKLQRKRQLHSRKIHFFSACFCPLGVLCCCLLLFQEQQICSLSLPLFLSSKSLNFLFFFFLTLFFSKLCWKSNRNGPGI